MADEQRDWQEQIREMAIDVRNEAIMQGASLYLLARRVLLAGLGAVALTADEAQAFVDKLVERGEIAEADAQQLIEDFKQKAQEQRTKVQAKAERGEQQTMNAFDERVAAVLQRMNVPAKRDIEALSKQIELLSAKIDSLQDRSSR